MKRFLALVLTAVLVLSMSTTAFAEGYNYTQGNTQEYSGSGETTVNAKIYSTCYVSIPETINYVEGETWDVSLTDMYVEDGYAIRVSVSNMSNDGSIVLTNPNESRKLDYTIEEVETHRLLSQNDPLLCELKYSDIEYDEIYGSTPCAFSFTGHIANETLSMKPGTYTGTMQYEVRIEPCA